MLAATHRSDAGSGRAVASLFFLDVRCWNAVGSGAKEALHRALHESPFPDISLILLTQLLCSSSPSTIVSRATSGARGQYFLLRVTPAISPTLHHLGAAPGLFGCLEHPQVLLVAAQLRQARPSLRPRPRSCREASIIRLSRPPGSCPAIFPSVTSGSQRLVRPPSLPTTLRTPSGLFLGLTTVCRLVV